MSIEWMEAVVSYDLVKIYEGGVKALDSVSLSVKSGRVFSLLGRNGAGKTTFLRIMATQLLPTSGKGYVLGYDIFSEAGKIRENIAVIPQESRPMYILTVKEHVKYFLMMRGVSMNEASRQASRILRDIGLEEYSDTLCMKLSGGLRRKVLVAMAMATEAEILFLDEPTTGLDPLSRRLVWDVIQRASSSGQTIFLTTHYMDEAEKISNEIAILHGGKILASGNIDEFRKLIPYKLKAEIATDNVIFEDIKKYGRTLTLGRRIIVYMIDEEDSRKLHEYCILNKIPVTFSPLSLEDVFIKLVGENEDS
ncbi:MAG: ABC transporter ATP-binding protein [Nitrososphaerota archaeon]